MPKAHVSLRIECLLLRTNLCGLQVWQAITEISVKLCLLTKLLSKRQRLCGLSTARRHFTRLKLCEHTYWSVLMAPNFEYLSKCGLMISDVCVGGVLVEKDKEGIDQPRPRVSVQRSQVILCTIKGIPLWKMKVWPCFWLTKVILTLNCEKLRLAILTA